MAWLRTIGSVFITAVTLLGRESWGMMTWLRIIGSVLKVAVTLLGGESWRMTWLRIIGFVLIAAGITWLRIIGFVLIATVTLLGGEKWGMTWLHIIGFVLIAVRMTWVRIIGFVLIVAITLLEGESWGMTWLRIIECVLIAVVILLGGESWGMIWLRIIGSVLIAAVALSRGALQIYQRFEEIRMTVDRWEQHDESFVLESTMDDEFGFLTGSPLTSPSNATRQFDAELLSWTSVKDISKDGGILKKVISEGESWENPKDLDEVFVRYEARLDDGTLISKSDGVEFTAEDGYFCPAVAKAVKTMEKGERVLLTVKPQYAFGEKGRPASGDEGAVPPDASLQINLELVSWKSVSDISKDKKVLKKTLKEGEKYDQRNDGSVVQVKLIGKLQDGTVFTKKGHDDEQPFEIKIDEEQVIEGLDRALKNMKKGEIALVTIQPEYAFGASGSPQELATVPPNSTVFYEVELLSFKNEKKSWEMNTAEKIEAAGKEKEEGNAYFKAGKYDRASKRYEKATGYIKCDSIFSDEEKRQTKGLKISCNLNNAACMLKLKDYREAAKLCTKVLELDSRNVKALYRRAQAYIQLEDLDLAEVDIKKALRIEPDNKDLKVKYRILKEKVRKYNKKDAQFYGSIFAKLDKPEQQMPQQNRSTYQ